MTVFSRTELQAEIETAEAALAELGDRERRLWDRLRIPPVKWEQDRYPGAGLVCVVAGMGCRCLYHNHVEGGWGWGQFETWGVVSQYHWQQDEIQHVISQTLVAIDEGGMG